MKCALSQKLTFISLLSPCAFMGLFRYFIVKVNKRGGRKQKVIVLRSRENASYKKITSAKRSRSAVRYAIIFLKLRRSYKLMSNAIKELQTTLKQKTFSESYSPSLSPPPLKVPPRGNHKGSATLEKLLLLKNRILFPLQLTFCENISHSIYGCNTF